MTREAAFFAMIMIKPLRVRYEARRGEMVELVSIRYQGKLAASPKVPIQAKRTDVMGIVTIQPSISVDGGANRQTRLSGCQSNHCWAH